MALCGVYWFLSRTNLKWGGESAVSYCSSLPTVLSFSNSCGKYWVGFYIGTGCTQKRLQNAGQIGNNGINLTHRFACGRLYGFVCGRVSVFIQLT